MQKKGKGSPYSITERMVPELILVLGRRQAAITFCQACGYPRDPRGLQPSRCLVNRGTTGVDSLPKTVTRQRRGCDLNPGPNVPESSMLPLSYRATHIHSITSQRVGGPDSRGCNTVRWTG